MRKESIAAARAALISGLSIQKLVADLEGKKYADLVRKHMRETADNLPALIAAHEELVLPEEEQAVQEILQQAMIDSLQPDFWATDAGDFLGSVSGNLNDALFPRPISEAGVFNLFQLITAKLADRARADPEFRPALSEPHEPSLLSPRKAGTVTRKLGIAVSDYDNGRISRRHLLSIFQAAIDNGDILVETNRHYVVANILPLIDAGELEPSEHIRTFESRIAAPLSRTLFLMRSAGTVKSSLFLLAAFSLAALFGGVVGMLVVSSLDFFGLHISSFRLWVVVLGVIPAGLMLKYLLSSGSTRHSSVE